MNLKHLFSLIRYTLLVAVVFGSAVLISSCDEDDGPTTFNGTTLELMQEAKFHQTDANSLEQADESLDSLLKYLTIYPELEALLSGPDHTIFAPSNSAFISLLATAGFPSNIKLINPDIVKGVLAYHIVSQKLLKKDLTSGLVLTSNFTDPLAPGAAQTITVNADGTLKTGSSDQAIKITVADNRATNGVVHVTNKVLIPNSTGAILTPILGTMAGTILLGKDFTNLAKVIQAADAGFTENQATGTFKVSTWLAMPKAAGSPVNPKGFTFFAPPNAITTSAGTTTIFSETTANALIASADKGRSFLLNHLVTAGQYTVADAPANNPDGITKFSTGTLTARSGKTLTVNVGTPSATNPYGVAITSAAPPTTGYAPIVKPDLAVSAGINNGTIQVIAGALN